MVMDLLPGGTTTPGHRRPAFTVAFGGGGGGAGGGLGDLASAVGGALGIDLGGGGDDPWARSLVALTVEAGCAPAVNRAEIRLAADAQAPPVALGDAGSIALGYADDPPQPVFTGTVTAVRRGLGGTTRITATDGGAILARLRVNQAYEQQTVGAIAGDLAGRAGVATGTIVDGQSLPFVVVDDRRGAYQHIAALARTGGLLAYVAPDGTLNVASPAGESPAQTFTFGQEILELEITEAAPVVARVTAVGEGAAGSQGQDAWSWLVKDPAAISATSGGGDPARLVSDRSLRTASAAQAAADGLVDAAARLARVGSLLVPGAPKVTLGGTIALAAVTDGTLNGSYLVLGVRHRYHKREGFTTRITVGAPGGGGGAGGLLGGLP